MATAVTCTVTVTRPPDGIVTDPWTVVPLMLKLAVVAPPLTLLPRLTALLNWLGKVSTKLPPVSVEGPAFVITKLNVVVPPTPTVVMLANLATVRLTAGVTFNAALTVAVFVPTDVVNDPAGIVLVIAPATELVTTVVTVQTPAGGMVNPAPSVKLLPPAVAVAAPPVQLVSAPVPVFTRPVGYISVNSAESVADTSAWVFVIVMVSSAVPPALMLASEKLLETTGFDVATRSRSWAEQTPAPTVQDAEGLVLVTLAGGVIDTTLLTWVWACASDAKKSNRNGKATNPTQRRT